ncbi:MAG: hypothetical protein MJ102_03050 [Clostridia bacterium]|nr:hypothetical protein [Clostridia bacterium]
MHNLIHIFSPKQIKKALFSISQESILILKTGISVVSLALCVLIFLAERDIPEDPFAYIRYYAPMTENILMTLVIIIGGALLLDISLKDKKK